MKGSKSNIEEAEEISSAIRRRLSQRSLTVDNISSTIVVLRSMQDFAVINKIYGMLFAEPNPPARVTISCGNAMPQKTNIIIHLKVHGSLLSSLDRKALHVQSRSYWAPANIGPYSQAVSIPSDASTNTWTVALAGQIPLIPHTMVLPEPSGYPLNDFKLQTILALQHLWRIGIEMKVGWFTSAVAYLPRQNINSLAGKSRIAARAWEHLHTPESKDDSDDDADTRDLWEEKYHAGINSPRLGKAKQKLPDWSIVAASNEDTAGKLVSPVFVVEVEELPRQSMIEWHAHLGVVNGPVKIDVKRKGNSWVAHVCRFGEAVQLSLFLRASEEVSNIRARTKEAFEYVGMNPLIAERSCVSYLDASCLDTIDTADYRSIVPCRSIWDGEGKRLIAVLLFDSASSDIQS